MHSLADAIFLADVSCLVSLISQSLPSDAMSAYHHDKGCLLLC